MGKNTFLQDFKAFAMKGNVIDMAVGVVIGGAFGKIVSSLVANVIMPPIGLLVGGVNFTDLKWVMKAAEIGADGKEIAPAVSLDYGQFLQATFDFLIIAFSIFLFIRLSSVRVSCSSNSDFCALTNPPVFVSLSLLISVRSGRSNLLSLQNLSGFSCFEYDTHLKGY